MRPLPCMLGAALALLIGCRGEPPSEPPPVEAEAAPAVGLRRMSVREYENTLHDLLGVEISARAWLPEDARDPFDNDYTLQQPSGVLVEGYEQLAIQVATEIGADPEARARVVGCDPTRDDACLGAFIDRFAPLAFRRPITDAQRADLLGLGERFATQTGDAWTGPEMVLRAVLQHPQFLYRIEVGEAQADSDLLLLDEYEILTRMSFLLWGTAPDAALMERTQGLREPDARRELAAEMLRDERARDQVAHFHALWLGYATLNQESELVQRMRTESDALVEDVIFDEARSHQELFTSPRTWVEPELATHYGWATDGTPGWVDVPETGRSGILGHGSFLAVASKFGDTSPTQRGKLVRERLMCEVVQPPPPDVNVDDPPESSDGSPCKWDRYAAHREASGCASCHQALDPVGFGLERWDHTGRLRAHDAGEPDCPIQGDGEIVGVGTFEGPGSLAELLVQGEFLDSCAVTQVFRYAHGRRERIEDRELLERATESFRTDEHRFDALLLALVDDPAFAWRRADTTEEAN